MKRMCRFSLTLFLSQREREDPALQLSGEILSRFSGPP